MPRPSHGTRRRFAFAGLAAIGAALLVMMVATEGEPGAIPLLLLVVGLGGLAHARWRGRRAGWARRAVARRAVECAHPPHRSRP